MPYWKDRLNTPANPALLRGSLAGAILTAIMARIPYGALLAGGAFLSAAAGANALDLKDVRYSGSNRTGVYNNSVTGPGAGGSFLTRDAHLTDDLSLNADYTSASAARWNLQFDGRIADDKRVDPHSLSVQRLSLDRATAARRLTLGDSYVSFSQYAMNQAIKGIRDEETGLPGLSLTGIAGIVKNRWDELWTRSSFEAVDRGVAAVRAAKTLPLASQIGLSAVASRDNRTAGSTADAYAERLVAVDWTLPSSAALAVSGESAWSRNTVDHSGTTPGETKNGSAHRVSARTRYGPWRSYNEFENVGTDFVTTVGAASPDLRRLATRNQVRLAPGLEGLVNLSWYRNNLDGSASDTARTVAPEAGLRWLGPLNRPSLTVEARLRWRRTTHSSAPVGDNRSLSEILSASDQFGSLNGTLEYEHRRDQRVGASKNDRNVLGLGLTGFHRWRELVLRPFLRWNLDHDKEHVGGTASQLTEAAAGLSVDHPSGLDASLSYRRASALQAGADDARRIVWELRTGYKMPGTRADRVEVGYRDNDNSFTTASKNYRESVVEGSYVRKF